MLNEAPNNSEFMHVANFVLNEVSNSNDAMHIENNVCLTICAYTMGAQQISVVAV